MIAAFGGLLPAIMHVLNTPTGQLAAIMQLLNES